MCIPIPILDILNGVCCYDTSDSPAPMTGLSLGCRVQRDICLLPSRKNLWFLDTMPSFCLQDWGKLYSGLREKKILNRDICTPIDWPRIQGVTMYFLYMSRVLTKNMILTGAWNSCVFFFHQKQSSQGLLMKLKPSTEQDLTFMTRTRFKTRLKSLYYCMSLL